MAKHVDQLLAQITNSTPTMSRACARCGRELTDAASMVAGIGPVCRKKTNKLFAQALPADVPQARKILEARRNYLRVKSPQVQPLLDAIVDTVRFGDEKTAQNDWRVCIKRIEWLLSTNQCAGGPMVETLYLVTEALGYEALVSLWKGELAIGSSKATTLTFNASSGRLVLTSVRPPKPVIKKLRQINGARFNGTSWTFPARQFAPVSAIVRRHFLAPQGVDEATAAARAYKVPAGSSSAPAQPQKPARHRLVVSAEVVQVFTPYNPSFIGAIKALPSGERRWNGAARCWEVRPQHRAAVATLIQDHYNTAPAVIAA